jgi:hypothetical protein
MTTRHESLPYIHSGWRGTLGLLVAFAMLATAPHVLLEIIHVYPGKDMRGFFYLIVLLVLYIGLAGATIVAAEKHLDEMWYRRD